MADTAQTTPGAAEDDVFTFESAANKEYPLAPQGQHDVIIARALFQMRENSFKPEAGKQPTVQLMLQSRQQYKAEDGTMKNYNLFKTMKISDHPKSGMFEFFRDVLGGEVPLVEVDNADGTKSKRIKLERKTEKVEDGEDRIHLPQFENLEFAVIVKHEKKDDGSGKMRDFIDSVFASPEQKASNLALFRAPQA